MQQQQVEYVVLSYRDHRMHRTYVDYMPFHWIVGDVLWFPPEGKSERATQVINKTTWRQYDIRKTYLETKTCVRKNAEHQATIIRKQEEKTAQDACENTSTTTDTDAPPVDRRQHHVGTQPKAVPPSAPSIQRQKPPPSSVFLEKSKKRRPHVSSEEEDDPTFMPVHRKKPKPGTFKSIPCVANTSARLPRRSLTPASSETSTRPCSQSTSPEHEAFSLSEVQSAVPDHEPTVLPNLQSTSHDLEASQPCSQSCSPDPETSIRQNSQCMPQAAQTSTESRANSATGDPETPTQPLSNSTTREPEISAKSRMQSYPRSAETFSQSGSYSTIRNPVISTQRILSCARPAVTLVDQQFAMPQRQSSAADGELQILVMFSYKGHGCSCSVFKYLYVTYTQDILFEFCTSLAILNRLSQ